MKTYVTRALAVCLMLLLATPLMANPKVRYQASIDEFRALLEEQESADTRKLAAEDLQDVHDWLDNAEKLLATGDYTRVNQLLKRVEYGLDLVTAVVGAAQMLVQAETQESGFGKAQEQIKNMRVEITKLQAEKQELQRQLQGLQ